MIENKLKYVNLDFLIQMSTDDCLCKDFINSGGHGNCLTISQSNKHNGRKMCYVVQPSGCKDLVDSGANPGEKYSEEACDRKGTTLNINLC